MNLPLGLFQHVSVFWSTSLAQSSAMAGFKNCRYPYCIEYLKLNSVALSGC